MEKEKMQQEIDIILNDIQEEVKKINVIKEKQIKELEEKLLKLKKSNEKNK